MNTTHLHLSLCAVAALAFSSCVHPLEKRITSNPKIYQSLSASDQLLVQQGRIREGMTKEAVFLAMGRADQVASGVQKGTRVEKWTYLGTQPVYTNNFGMGWGSGWGNRGWGRGPFGSGYGYGGAWDPLWNGGPSVVYVPYKAASVSFRGNRVTEYITGPQ
ncbi:MAG: hypothetical protein ABL974_18425 [Prosthecobacter sp.]